MEQWNDEAVRALRGAVYRADGSIVEVLRGRLTDEVLQLAGDGLLQAVTQNIDGAPELGRQCATALRERGWEGDNDLADQLQAVLGEGAAPLLHAVPVDLEDLASLMEGDSLSGGARIDLRTGDCWPRSSEFSGDDEDADDDDDDPDRWLYAWPVGSGDAYRDMELFIATVDDPERADRLNIAITGRGAFRRFKDVLVRWPPELDRYYLFSDERKRGRARAWLAGEGYRPGPTAGD